MAFFIIVSKKRWETHFLVKKHKFCCFFFRAIFSQTGFSCVLPCRMFFTHILHIYLWRKSYKIKILNHYSIGFIKCLGTPFWIGLFTTKLPKNFKRFLSLSYEGNLWLLFVRWRTNVRKRLVVWRICYLEEWPFEIALIDCFFIQKGFLVKNKNSEWFNLIQF